MVERSPFFGIGFWLIAFIALSSAGVPLSRYESVMMKQPQETGLYNASDKVNVLTDVNFNSTVLEQNRSTLVEFYNSYCGHCKRFAPYYKELAEQLHPWRDVLLVSAIDCAVEENNGICREYEVMAYPTLRYMSPGFKPAEKSYGHEVEAQIVDEMRAKLAQFVAAENRTILRNDKWPDFQPLSESEVSAPFKGLAEHIQLIIVVYDADNTSTIGMEAQLHFVQWPGVHIRRVADANVASALKIDGTKYKLASVDRSAHIIPYTTTINNSSVAVIETIESILNANHITTHKPAVIRTTPAGGSAQLENKPIIANEAIIAEVQRNKHAVYQADLEMAIRVILFNEIPKTSNMSEERVTLLRRFIKLLNLYNPLDTNGQTFVAKLNDYVQQHNQSISAKEFEEELHRLENELQPVFAPSIGYVGCAGSMPGLRGYTCSLWTLFHYFTVQAAITPSTATTDPQEPLRVIWGYVKNFFGCTNCAEHFQELSQRDRIWNVSGRDSVILWLWRAHNSVNQRLAGDATEDPKFVKQQFPTIDSCPQCYNSPPDAQNNADNVIDWNRDEVLAFLKDIYSREQINYFGLDVENHPKQEHPTVASLRQKRTIGISVFSEMDVRMGMLLYGFCIVMMIVAFKLFVFKGYRKKPYGHDILGKV